VGIKSPSLEHLTDPLGGLPCLKRVVKEGGSITVVEGVREKALALGLIDRPGRSAKGARRSGNLPRAKASNMPSQGSR
jgi:hypothetical protein